jgi:hypothetical protein
MEITQTIALLSFITLALALAAPLAYVIENRPTARVRAQARIARNTNRAERAANREIRRLGVEFR